MEFSELAALFKCNKCGSCTSVCPLYQQTVYEGMAARGKLALLEATVDGRLDSPRALRAKLEELAREWGAKGLAYLVYDGCRTAARDRRSGVVDRRKRSQSQRASL